eukprot:5090814-Prymnesium_polylepis.1
MTFITWRLDCIIRLGCRNDLARNPASLAGKVTTVNASPMTNQRSVPPAPLPRSRVIIAFAYSTAGSFYFEYMLR